MALRVLIVDDSAFTRKILKGILTEAGHEIVGEAQDGLEAMRRYKELKPDLVTMDITMPDMDGLEALKQIRELDSNAKILMCSALSRSDIIMEAMNNGALNFLIKPFRKDSVLEAINRIS